MRIWSIHPRYLDAKGLVALWRETLLAQAVLAGRTKGYRNHPQLERWRECADPLEAIGRYLQGVWEEASRRGYRFDQSKIDSVNTETLLEVTRGQLEYEARHLRRKLAERDPEGQQYQWLIKEEHVQAHPIFTVVEGEIAPWERQQH